MNYPDVFGAYNGHEGGGEWCPKPSQLVNPV